MNRACLFFLALSLSLVGRASAADPQGLDKPIRVQCGVPGGVPGAIAEVDRNLGDEDCVFFGEAVNALREEFRYYSSGKLSRDDIRRCEETLLDGMTPRQIILAGLPLYRRQNHSPEAGKGEHEDWAPKHRMSDKQIEQALIRYAKKG